MFEIFKSQFEEAKQTLKDVETGIKRITGRDPNEYTITATGNLKLKNDLKFSSNNNSFQQRKRTFTNRFGNQVQGDHVDWEGEEEEEDEGVVTDDSPDEDEESLVKKPSLQSTVVATKRDVKSRKATMEEQKSDSRGFARNRRMFGFVLGTLQKFQKEESQHKAMAEKRAEIDKKLEAAAEKEKEQMKKEKEQMFVKRRKKQSLMRCLEKKMEIAKIHEVWESNHKLLTNFVRTQAEPVIMFAPVKHNDKSKKKLQESQKRVTEIIMAQKAKIEQELHELDQWYMKDDDKDDTEDDTENKITCEPESQTFITKSQIQIEAMDETSNSQDQTLTKNEDYTDGPGEDDENMDQSDIKENRIQDEFEPIYDDE